MLRTRLWMGAALIVLTVGVLLLDQRLAPWYPFLLVLVLLLTLGSCYELLQLLPISRRPPSWLCYTAVTALVAANWLGTLAPWPVAAVARNPWLWIVWVFAGLVLTSFVAEMAAFEGPGESVTRMALAVWIAAYLGLLSSFLIQLRWLPGLSTTAGEERATAALMLAIFVPKCGDIGAYFIGRLLGRHPMAPTLSPKKTWEGAGGGVAAAIMAAIGIDRLGSVVRGGWLSAAGLGAALAVAGIFGDLAESLIKREARQKDASQVVPGFGGILDVVDSVLFAAPVAYWWIN